MARKYDKTKPYTNTLVEVKKSVWAKFKLIFELKSQNKSEAMTEAIKDFNEKNKGVLG